MTIGNFIFARLSGNTQAGGRVYPSSVPQRNPSFPAIMYEENSGGELTHLTGAGGTAFSEVEINCIGNTHDEANAVAEEARKHLNGFSGSAGGVTIQHCLLEDGTRRFGSYVSPDAEQQTKFLVSMVFDIMYLADSPIT